MFRALIIDDEKQVIKDLTGLIDIYCPKIELCGSATSSEDARRLIHSEKPDIVFLDIQIDQKTGIDLLKSIPQPTFQVIFVTAHQQYAIEAFKLSAIDYLLKPVDPDELVHAVDKAIEMLDQQALQSQLTALAHNLGQQLKPKKIVLTDLEGVHILDVTDILWCHANGSYTEFQLQNGQKMVVSRHLKTYEHMLQQHGFYRVHRSYIINANSIVQVNRSQGVVLMKNDHEVPVSIPTEVLKQIIDHL